MAPTAPLLWAWAVLSSTGIRRTGAASPTPAATDAVRIVTPAPTVGGSDAAAAEPRAPMACTVGRGRRFAGHTLRVWVGNSADAYFPVLDAPPVYVNDTADGGFARRCSTMCTETPGCFNWCYRRERPGIGGMCFFFAQGAEALAYDPMYLGGECFPDSPEAAGPAGSGTVSTTRTQATSTTTTSASTSSSSSTTSTEVQASPAAHGLVTTVGLPRVVAAAGGAAALTLLTLLLLGLGWWRVWRRCRSRRDIDGDACDVERAGPCSKFCEQPRHLTRSTTARTARTRSSGALRSTGDCSRGAIEAPGDLAADPAMWGLRVDQLVMFYEHHRQFLEAYCQDHRLDTDGKTHVCMKCPCPHEHGQARHRPATSADSALPELALTMHVVVDLLIKPLTAIDGGDLGYAPLFNKQAPLRASILVSHCWSELFPDFVQTLEKHLWPSAVVWVCSFALPQNGDINRLVSQCELEESPFAQALMQADRMLVVVDERILPLERIWCLYEMYICALHRIRMDVRAPTMSKTLFRDILKKVEHTDICNCKSTNEDDRLRILHAVYGFEHQVNSTIRQSVEELVRLMESVED